MKKLTSILIGCSLMFAGAAIAQQPDEQPSVAEKHAPEKGKGHAGPAKPDVGDAAAKPQEAPAAKEHGAKSEHAAPAKEPKADAGEGAKPAGVPAEKHGGRHAAEAPKPPKTEATPKAEMTPKATASVAPTKATSEPAAVATPAVKPDARHGHKDAKSAAPAATASVAPTTAASATATPAPSIAATSTPAAATASATPVTAASASATVSPAATTSSSVAAIATPKPNTAAATKKPDQQKVQQIKAEHATFRAQPNPQVAPAVTFNPSYRVEGSDRWQGQQYEVFRSYHPERHDENYYRSRYSRVELIGGGYYYENNDYWYPAWGYNPRNEYYAYDGPIYAGHRHEPPDRVIADVQASLQEMGYYKGQVDGLLGPLTRKALLGYQEDAGLTATAAIDEPTLEALNMSS